MGNSAMVKPCPALRVLSVLVVLSMTMTVPCAFDVDAVGEEPGIEGIQPPVDGDWDITSDTNVRGVDITIHGNITIASRVTLQVFGSNLTVVGGNGWTSTIDIRIASSLTMDRSTIHADNIEAREQAAVRLNLTEVHAKGRIRMSTGLLSVQGSTIRLEPSGASTGTGCTGASLNLSAQVSGELKESTVVCAGGDAGLTLPGQNGSAGGPADAVIACTDISGCDDTVTAGKAASGGLGMAGADGGSGGRGGNASLSIVTGRIEDSTIVVTGSTGGDGACGSDNVDGGAGEGGDGAPGGDVRVCISSIPNPDLNNCELYNCTVRIDAGGGGSGGNGGSSTHGDGGFGGYAGPGGIASLSVASSGDVLLSKIKVSSNGGGGGFGGDYGRRSDGSRSNGGPRPGGRGGDADISVAGDHDCILRNVSLTSEAGSGYDGGSGYDQGEMGGDGGDSVLSIMMGERVDAVDTSFESRGGVGGNGGPAYSNIFGNGGNGGNPRLEVVGDLSIYMRRFELLLHPGTGGHGNTRIWNGKDGIASFELMTEYLEMWDGSLGAPLDDLDGNARGYLYNCSFDFSGLPALPLEDAEVWTYYPVDIWVVSSFDPSMGKPLKRYEVRIIDVSTSMVVAIGWTDENGRVSFYLPSFHYTSREVHYLGGYIVSVVPFDHRGVKEARMDVQEAMLWPNPFIFGIDTIPHMVKVTIEIPQNETQFHLSRVDKWLEVEGYVTTSDPDNVTEVFLELYRVGEANNSGARLVLQPSPIDLFDVPDDDYQWGRFFRPGKDSNKWRFYGRIDVFLDAGATNLTSVDYVVRAHACDGAFWGIDNRTIRLIIFQNMGPTLDITTDVRIIDWSVAESILLEGTAWDDIGVVAVERRIDGGEWEPVNGTTTWSTWLDVSELSEGNHTVSLRADDGTMYSHVSYIPVSIDRPEDDGDGPDGGPFASAPTWLWLVLIIAVAALVAGALVWRRRRTNHAEKDDRR